MRGVGYGPSSRQCVPQFAFTLPIASVAKSLTLALHAATQFSALAGSASMVVSSVSMTVLDSALAIMGRCMVETRPGTLEVHGSGSAPSEVVALSWHTTRVESRSTMLMAISSLATVNARFGFTRSTRLAALFAWLCMSHVQECGARLTTS